jgi:hypothetical protein
MRIQNLGFKYPKIFLTIAPARARLLRVPALTFPAI